MAQIKGRVRQRHSQQRAVTLLELLIGIVLFSLIALVLSTVDLFSRQNVIGSERRARLQNEVSYVLEHMTKEITRTIGNEVVNGAQSVAFIDNEPNWVLLRVYIDANGNGRRDTGAGTDRWIAYILRLVPPASRNQMWYCPQCTNFQCTFCVPAWGTATNILSRQITNFTPTKPGGAVLSDNFITVQTTACWDPDGVPDACGTAANPSVTMSSRIEMPSVSIR